MENFSFTKNQFINTNCFTVKIPHQLISILRQTRTDMSYEGLQALTSSVKNNGQQTPGIIFAFSESEARKYLSDINKLWHRSYKLSGFHSVYIEEKKANFYLFLIAGHRRFQASKIAKVNYLAEIYFSKTFKDAITRQYEENFHEEIPLYDLINFASYLWVKSKLENPKLTLKAFSKKIHKSTSWLSNALKFTTLPIKIQALINESEIQKGVNYSILIEFAKFYEMSVKNNNPFDEDLLFALINHSIVYKYNLGKVKEFLKVKKEEFFGQQVLFELKNEEINSNSLRELRKNVTLDTNRVKTYIDSVEPFAKRVTEKAKKNSREILVKSKQLVKKLNK